jgi:hypothetical protein
MSASLARLAEMTRVDVMTAIRSSRTPLDGIKKNHHKGYLATVSKVAMLTLKLEVLPPARPLRGDLAERHFPEELMPALRPWITVTFNHLAHTEALGILSRPTDELYVYEGKDKFTACLELYPIVKKYMAISCPASFHSVLTPVVALKNRDLVDLHKCVLTEKLSSAQQHLDRLEDFLYETYSTHHHHVALLTIPPEQFQKGDFSFHSNPVTKQMLKNAFDLIEASGRWDALDFEANRNLLLRNVMHEMEKKDSHTEYSMRFVMTHMHTIRKVGWEKYVLEYYQVARKELDDAKGR